MSWTDGGAPRAKSTQYGAVVPCTECGATPGAEAIFRAQRVVLVIRHPEIARGPFCRECGIGTFRRYTAYTVARGWKGLFALLTPWIVARNLIARRRILALPEGYDSPPIRPQIRAGKPIWRRKQIFGLLQPVVAVAVVLGVVWLFTPKPVVPLPGGLWQVGACVQLEKSGDAILVDCHGGHNGEIIAVVDDQNQCPDETSWYGELRGTVLIACVRTA
jgi:hypothetical protein